AADPHREGLTAGVALAQAGAAALAAQAANLAGVGIAAMRASRAIRPKPGLDIGKSSILVMEMRGGKDRIGHGNLLWPQYYTYGVGLSSVTSPVSAHRSRWRHGR